MVIPAVVVSVSNDRQYFARDAVGLVGVKSCFFCGMFAARMDDYLLKAP